MNQAEKSGLPIRLLFSEQQKGDSFGQKLVNGLFDLKSEGFEHVIVLGNDTPFVTVTDLSRTQNLLESGSHVIAPDQHGGSWILGLRLNTLDFYLFESLPWQTKDLYNSLKLLLSPSELHDSVDLNTIQDVYSLMKFSGLKRGQRIFLKSVFLFFKRAFSTERIYCSSMVSRSVLRGPPQLI